MEKSADSFRGFPPVIINLNAQNLSVKISHPFTGLDLLPYRFILNCDLSKGAYFLGKGHFFVLLPHEY